MFLTPKNAWMLEVNITKIAFIRRQFDDTFVQNGAF